jgi:hypothetical protein
MLFTFILIAIILAFIYIIFSYTLFPVIRLALINKRLAREGVEADAILLDMEKTGVYVNRQPQVRMQVQVQPLTGRNFVSEVRQVFTAFDLKRLRIGTSIKVKYNPMNTKEVMILRR